MATKLNAVGGRRRFWGTLPALPAKDLTRTVQAMETSGFEGTFVLQFGGPPFTALGATATVTEALKLATGVAVIGSRSLTETAHAALDLDRISGGRFILGLGTAFPAAVESIYGMPPHPPVASMREAVAVIRYIIANAHRGLDPYEGKYFKASFQEAMLSPPPVRERIPIWIAALQDKMTELAIEVADGLMVHALWSAEYTQSQKPAIDGALAKHGRRREDIEINAWPWIAINKDKRQAIEDARPTVAGYSGYRQYEPFFEKLGFGEQARACQLALGDHGRVDKVLHNVPDEMVLAFCACGPLEEIVEQIEPYWEVVDSLAPMTPYRNLPPEKLAFYYQGLFELAAAVK